MVRSSYIIDAGNPIQTTQVPRRKLSQEYLYAGGSSEISARIRKQTLLLLFVLDLWLAISMLLLGHISPTLAYLGTFLMLLPIIRETVRDGAGRQLLVIGAILATTVTVKLACDAPFQFSVLIFALLQSALILLCGQHWIHRCTTAPLNRHEASSLRRQALQSLWATAGFPVVIALTVILLQTSAAYLWIVLLVGCVQLLRSGPMNRVWARVLHVLTSWLAYNTNDVQAPGLFQSPWGTQAQRRTLLLGGALCFSSIYWISGNNSSAGGSLSMILVGGPFPSLMFLLAPLLMLTPICEELAVYRQRKGTGTNWSETVEDLRTSTNPIERESYFQGTVASDGSPLLISRKVFDEPSHFLGSSGSGKTSKGLNPWLEQTIAFGDSSVIVVDLKADTLELLSTMRCAADALRKRSGADLPLKFFTLQDDLPTFAFNPFCMPFWKKLNVDQRIDLVCAALSLTFGSDYGKGYFSAMSAAFLRQVFKIYPHCRNFRELADRCSHLANSKTHSDLSADVKGSASHLIELLNRLASYEQLQVHPGGQYPEDIVEQAIDLADYFKEPQLLYLHLGSTLSPGAAPTVARLFVYILLASASQIERNNRVYLVIDEFQRMANQNMDYLLQLARSMGVGLVLSNQSLEDLNSPSGNLISCVETNCRYRQWFDVGSFEDRQRIMASVGETVEIFSSQTIGTSQSGATFSRTSSETLLPRLSINEILDVGSRQDLSLVRLSRGEAYAQHAGLPIVVRSDFHISQSEYAFRKAMPWPDKAAGMLIAKDLVANAEQSSSPVGPTFFRDESETATDANVVSDENLDQLFKGLLGNVDEEKPKKRKPRPSSDDPSDN